MYHSFRLYRYEDTIFYIVKRPFTHLFSIYSFLKSDDNTKQVPLMFVLMSGKRRRDYTKVPEEVLRVLPDDPAVEHLVINFEAALWRAADQCVIAMYLIVKRYTMMYILIIHCSNCRFMQIFWGLLVFWRVTARTCLVGHGVGTGHSLHQ